MEDNTPTILLSKNILTDIRELSIEILTKCKQLEVKQEDLQRQILILHQQQYELKKQVNIDPLAEVKHITPTGISVINTPAVRRSATMTPKKPPARLLK